MAVGDMDAVRLSSNDQPSRADGLWRSTCFEAFIRPHAGDAYFEFNFAPSGDWAAYRFESYRFGMAAAEVAPPDIKWSAHAGQTALVANIDLGPLPELVPWEAWGIGLSAVIEANDGSLSYWALSHGSGAPDFHHRDCFAAELAPAETL